MRLPLLPFLLLFSLLSWGQQYADKKFFLVDSLDKSKLENYDLGLLDSMLTIYHKEKVDTTKLSHILFMVENLEDQNAWIPYNDILFKTAKKALENKNLDKATNRFYKNILAGAYNNLGFYYNQIGKKEFALNYFKNSMELLEEINNKQGLSDVYNNIGLIYKNVGQISKCLEYYFKCLKICDELNDKRGKASSLNNIGMMYMDLGEYVKSLEYLRDALTEWEKLDVKRGMSSSLGNLGLLYSKMGRPNMSLEYYFKALILNEKNGDKEGIGTSLGNIGWIFFEQNKYQKALDYFERSLSYRKLVNDQAGIAYGYHSLGSVYRKLENYDLALEYGNKSYEMGKKLGYPDIVKRSSLLLYTVYKEKKMPSEALEMYEDFMQMRDSIQSEQTRKDGIKKQYQYEFDIKEKEYKSEQEKREIQYNSEIQRQKLVFNVSLIGGIILLLFLAVLYQRFRITNKQKAIIVDQKKELDNAFNALHEKNKEVMDSIYYARRIQSALLTTNEYFDKHLKKDYFILYKPKDIVSGDFYWATNIVQNGLNNLKIDQSSTPDDLNNLKQPLNLFYLAVCDSTGHGVPGAFMSLLNIGFLSEAINEKGLRNPNEIFSYTRKRLIENVNKEGQKDGFDGTLLCFESIENGNTQITYSSAYCKPVLVRNGRAIPLQNDRMPVGMSERMEDFKLYSITAEANDMLFLFTDGFADQFGGPKGKKFKYRPLEELMTSIANKPVNVQQEKLNKVFDDWKGHLEQVDDVCVIGIRL
ncbi:MAG: protein serine/threonine phosphatase [Bacteroidetes bacterium]|jgi:tetratricopeptide (TPR) repeat protein|nr:protein serine/threonine phosphatase [Bacteroidota bacterium]